MHKALRLAREDVARSGRQVQGVPRGARPQAIRRPLRRAEPASRVLRPLPLRPRPVTAAALCRRFGDDRDLLGLKLILLIGIGLLTAVLELVR